MGTSESHDSVSLLVSDCNLTGEGMRVGAHPYVLLVPSLSMISHRPEDFKKSMNAHHLPFTFFRRLEIGRA